MCKQGLTSQTIHDIPFINARNTIKYLIRPLIVKDFLEYKQLKLHVMAFCFQLIAKWIAIATANL